MDDTSEEAFNRVLEGYKRVLDKIGERVSRDEGRFEVIYYAIPIPERNGEKMSRVKAFAVRLNEFMKDDRFVD